MMWSKHILSDEALDKVKEALHSPDPSRVLAAEVLLKAHHAACASAQAWAAYDKRDKIDGN